MFFIFHAYIIVKIFTIFVNPIDTLKNIGYNGYVNITIINKGDFVRKIAFSLMAILSLSQLMYAGGSIVPAEEPAVEMPVVAENANIWQQEATIYGWLAGVSADTLASNSTERL